MVNSDRLEVLIGVVKPRRNDKQSKRTPRGWKLETYRAWKHSHAREVPFPGGESLDDAALRYARAFRKLLALPHDTVLVVTHEIPIRYALNGASGSDSLDGPAHEVENAVAYLFDDEALARAADGIETILAG